MRELDFRAALPRRLSAKFEFQALVSGGKSHRAPRKVPCGNLAWPSSLLVHRRGKERHFDLVIGCGAKCPTLSVTSGCCRKVTWLAPHRRRYLTFSGSLGGDRGVVRKIWSGKVHWNRRPHGYVFHLLHFTTWFVTKGTLNSP